MAEAGENVVGLHGNRPSALGEPRLDLIAMLRDVLAMAEQGRLQSFIGTGFVSDGGRLAMWGDHHENVYEMMGALAWLQAEYVERHSEPRG